jgi:hypothetical protein
MEELINALAGIKGVMAVGLGGSRGMNLANPQSDYDFVIFRLGGSPVAPALIVDAISPLVDADSIIDTAGFVRARIKGVKFDVFQKDMYLIEREISAAREGKFNWTIRPLFPHGDLSTCQISHVVHLEICAEQNGLLSQLKQLARPYPLLLLHSMINTFLTQSSNTAIHASKITNSDERQQLMALCSTFFFYANLLIFAFNKQYPVLEKGARQLIAGLPLQPQNYAERITRTFQATLDGHAEVVAADLMAMQAELQDLSTQTFATLKTVST